MAKDPAMLFYTADFLIGVAFMTMEERGQYITLLCFQQQRGHLTIDEMTKAVGEVSPAVLEKFVRDEDGRYYNERAEKEIIARREHVANKLKNFYRAESPCGKSVREVRADTPSGNTARENENEIVNETVNETVKKEKGGMGEKGNIRKPTLAEVVAYCKEKNNGVDAEAFYNYYEAMGWQSCGKPLTKWKYAIGVWANDGGDG